jgi:hypothetical protein
MDSYFGYGGDARTRSLAGSVKPGAFARSLEGSVNLWEEYERRKKILLETCKTSEEYETAIRNLCEELGI